MSDYVPETPDDGIENLPAFTGRQYTYGADPSVMRTLDGHIEPYRIEIPADGTDEDLSNPHIFNGGQ
jgi:hypothetical protein